MSEKRRTFPFVEDQPLSDRKINQIVYALGKFGLTPAFDIPNNPSDDDILAEHLKVAPLPKSDQDFMGHEHFWKIGDQAGLTRYMSTRLFKLLVFPQRKPLYHEETGHGISIQTTELGLVVTSRQAIGMPSIPVDIQPPVNYGIAVHGHRSTFKVGFDVETAVVQAEGVIALAQNIPLASSLYGAGPGALRSLGKLGAQLGLMVGVETSSS